MSAGRILTLGLGTFSDVHHVVTLGYGTGATPTPTPTPVEVTPTPAGRASRAPQRRRYIMPDGTVLYATTQEAFDWLQLYTKPAAESEPKKSAKPARVVAPRIVLEKRDVRFVPAEDAIPGTYKAVISKRFTYEPPPEATRQAQERINRMRADEEAILALIL